MTYLITLICILIALLLFAGAFYLAKYVVTLQHRVHVLEDSYKTAMEHITSQEEHVKQLELTIEYMDKEVKMAGVRQERTRTWNPSDPMNSEARM